MGQVLEGLLKLWKETGAKVLIFSNSLQVLGLLKDLMCGASYNYCVLDGSVPSDEREYWPSLLAFLVGLLKIRNNFRNGAGRYL